MGITNPKKYMQRLKTGAKQRARKQAIHEIKTHVINQFFGEQGLPPEIKAGWAELEQRRAIREQIGNPISGGACFLLNYDSVLHGALAEMHSSLAKTLNLPTEAIRLNLDRGDGYIRPVADIQVPENWMAPGIKTEGKSASQMIKTYLDSVIDNYSDWFRQVVHDRLGHHGPNPDYSPAVVGSYGPQE